MLTGQYQYPSDPIEGFVLLYGLEFSKIRGKGQIVVHSINAKGELFEQSRVEFDECLCDICNDEVRAMEPCVMTDRLLYCYKCGKKYVLQYLVDDSLKIKENV